MLSRRTALIGPLPFILASHHAYADEADQQIALDTSGEFILAASTTEAKQHNQIEPPHFIGGAPPYPATAKMTRSEGYVIGQLNVLPNGSGEDFRVIDSYPEGLFEKTVQEQAPRFKFSPATINGEPRPTRGYKVAVKFAISGQRGVTEDDARAFVQLRKAIIARDLDKAASYIAKLEERRAIGKLNMVELVRFYDFAARVALFKNNNIEANELNTRCLRLGDYLDSKAALAGAYELRVILFTTLGRYDQAVDVYDSYKAIYRGNDADMARIINALREKGFGKGVHYPILKGVISGA